MILLLLKNTKAAVQRLTWTLKTTWILKNKHGLKYYHKIKKIFRRKFHRIRQATEKVLDKDTTLAEWIRTLFYEQGITTVSIITDLSMTISTVAFTITGCFGRGIGPAASGSSQPKDNSALKKWLNIPSKELLVRLLKHCLLL